MRVGRDRALRWLELSVAAVAAATVGTAFRPAISGDLFWFVLAVCLTVPVALSVLLTGQLSWPLRRVAVVSGALCLSGLAALLFTDFTRPGPWLLDYLPPAPGTAPLLIVPGLLTWLAAGTAAELSYRGRTAAVVAVPALAAWPVAMALSVPDRAWHLTGVAVLLLCAAALTVRRGPARGAVTAWGGAVVITVLAIAAAGPASRVSVWTRQAIDVRDVLPPSPVRINGDLLAEYDRWRASPRAVLFATDSRTGPWRLATLDDLHTEVWTPTGDFRLAGSAVTLTGTGAQVERQVLVRGLSGAFLPGLPHERAIRAGQALWLDPGTGVLAEPAGATDRHYVLATSSGGGTDPTAARGHLQHHDLPPACRPGIAKLVARAGSTRTSPTLPAATALAARTADYLRLAPAGSAAPGGYGCTAVDRMVNQRRATVEQRLVAFVLAAWFTGYSARMAIGFAPGSTGEDGWTSYAGRDATLTAEIRIGNRWIPVPMPGDAVSGEAADLSAVPPQPPSPPAPSTLSSVSRNVSWVWGLVLLAALTLLLGLTQVSRRLAAAWRSRRARLRGSPGQRVIAAWRDARHRARRAGVSELPGETLTEFVERAGRGVDAAGQKALSLLGVSAAEVLYGGAEAADREAQDAWRCRDEFIRALRAVRHPHSRRPAHLEVPAL